MTARQLADNAREFLRAFVRAMGDPETFRAAARELLIILGIFAYFLAIFALASWMDR
jgi:hypothetical protein